jgi:hypothetical protein
MTDLENDELCKQIEQWTAALGHKDYLRMLNIAMSLDAFGGAFEPKTGATKSDTKLCQELPRNLIDWDKRMTGKDTSMISNEQRAMNIKTLLELAPEIAMGSSVRWMLKNEAKLKQYRKAPRDPAIEYFFSHHFFEIDRRNHHSTIRTNRTWVKSKASRDH